MKQTLIAGLFNPKSVAVIGASRSPEKVGHQVLRNLVEGGYRGKLYPVNPNARSILGVKTYPTLQDIGETVEVAVIAVPAPLVQVIIEECKQLGVSYAVVITAGFAEAGGKGRDLQQSLSKQLEGSGLRVLGPNCLGFLSTVNRVNATFGPALPQKGGVMLISQSGALVTGVLDWAYSHKLGISQAVTLGNRLDISEIEALDYALKNPDTKIVMVYLESFANAPEFFALAAKVSLKKPVLLLKGGRSLAGQSASASHTAALATDQVLVEALAKQTGVLMAQSIEEWLNLAALFAQVGKVKGSDLAIITNAGGPGVLGTDEAVARDLSVTPFSPQIAKKLKKVFEGNGRNPLDVLGDASPEDFAAALKIVSRDPVHDSIVTIVTPQAMTKPFQTARVLVEFKKQNKKPLAVVFLGGDQLNKAVQLVEKAGIPVFTFPGEAISLLARKAGYDKHERHDYPAAYRSPLKKEALLKAGRLLARPLTLENTFGLLKLYGLELPKYEITDQTSIIAEALNRVGRPAVIKTASMDLPHKLRSGGVVLDVMTGPQARMTFRKMQRLYPKVLFQETIHDGAEMIIGAKRDPQLGPFITVGLGGSHTNALKDRGYLFLPAAKEAFRQVFAQTAAYRVLTEAGLPVLPVLKDMEAVAAIMLDLPEISEMEINPVLVTKSKTYAADIKITLRE